MKARTKRIPKLASEAAERRFWEGRDSTPYVDWSRAERAVLPNLKPTTGELPRRALPVAHQDLARGEALGLSCPTAPPSRGRRGRRLSRPA